mgnify:FL=1
MITPGSQRPDLVSSLLCASAYPHAVESIELIETHISWVFLTGDFAYKVKKPVDLGFLNFETLEQRRHYCYEELRLNRAWAPSVYLDVVPLVSVNGAICVDGDGEAVEYALRMRQFDQEMRLDHRIDAGQLTHEDVRSLAEEIARRHADARRVQGTSALVETTERLIWDNFEALAGVVPGVSLPQLREWTQKKLQAHAALIRARCDDGHYRDCHGDLHLGNLVAVDNGFRAFDCIEFSREFREIDVVADYAFLLMDFIARGAPDLATVFANRYLEKTGDYSGACLLPVYLVYRSMVRAKVAALLPHGETHDQATIRRYIALARAHAAQRRPILVCMTGLAGSGKTWLSTRLLARFPAIRLRSDLERKRLFGFAETADSHSGIGEGIYDRDAGAAVYERLLSQGADLLSAGLNVILDATFLDVRDRKLARQMAERVGAGAVLVQAIASQDALRARVRDRAAAPSVSEADISVLEHQLDTAVPLDDDELVAAVVVDTEADIDISAITAKIRQTASAADL